MSYIIHHSKILLTKNGRVVRLCIYHRHLTDVNGRKTIFVSFNIFFEKKCLATSSTDPIWCFCFFSMWTRAFNLCPWFNSSSIAARQSFYLSSWIYFFHMILIKLSTKRLFSTDKPIEIPYVKKHYYSYTTMKNKIEKKMKNERKEMWYNDASGKLLWRNSKNQEGRTCKLVEIFWSLHHLIDKNRSKH
jgi:hypothetical protein